jgi:hydrogenase large subunit
VAQVGPLARVLNGLAAGHEPTKKYATAALDTVSALAKTKVGLDAMHSTIGRHAARAISCACKVDMLAEQWNLLIGNIGKGDSRPSTRRSSPRTKSWASASTRRRAARCRTGW